MSDVELTEFTDLDPDELHLVKRGANGFPALLAKAAAAEVGLHQDELAEYSRRVRGKAVNPQPKPQKEKKGKVKKSPLAKAMEAAVKAGTPEAVGGLAFSAYRASAAQNRQRIRKALGLGANEGERHRALDGASRPAIRSATRPWKAAPNPAVVLRDVASSRAASVEVPASVRNATVQQVNAHRQDSTADSGELEGEIQALKAALAKSTDVLERERLSWQLTRKQLVQGHRLGVI